MSDPAIVKAAAQAINEITEMPDNWDEQDSRLLALVVLEAVEPLLRAAALEQAIKAIESAPYADTRDEAIAVLRALKEQP